MDAEHAAAAHNLMTQVIGNNEYKDSPPLLKIHDKLCRALSRAHSVAPLRGASLSHFMTKAKPFVENDYKVAKASSPHNGSIARFNAEMIKKMGLSRKQVDEIIARHVKNTAHLGPRPIYRHDPRFLYASLVRPRSTFGNKRYERLHPHAGDAHPELRIARFAQGIGNGLAGGALYGESPSIRPPKGGLAARLSGLGDGGPLPMTSIAKGSQAALEALTPARPPTAILFNYGGNSKFPESTKPGGPVGRG
jgi:hypothetical protein